jgi:hypothetical protein
MNAFAISEDDIENVLWSNENRILHAEASDIPRLASEIFPMLDFQLIEDAALYGNSMEEQTDYALDEIKRQLIDLKILDEDE